MTNKVVPLFPNKPSAIDLFAYDPSDDSISIDNIVQKNEMDINEYMEEVRIGQTAITLTNMLVNAIEQCGYPHPALEEDTQRDFCLVIESLISLIKRYNEYHHELQDLADIAIILEDDEDDYEYSFIPTKFVKRKDEQSSD